MYCRGVSRSGGTEALSERNPYMPLTRTTYPATSTMSRPRNREKGFRAMRKPSSTMESTTEGMVTSKRLRGNLCTA